MSELQLRAIGVIPHPSKDASTSIDLIARWAERNNAYLLTTEASTLTEQVALEELLGRADALVALGGDGTMLGAMRLAAEGSRDIPVLGVNHGNVGFLVEIEPAELPAALDRLGRGDYELEPHHALEYTIHQDDRIESGLVFNDLALVRQPGRGVTSADLSIDARDYGYYRADGIVIATPAGSTAYNHAANGPVLSPASDAYVVTPVAPMSGINRSVVLAGREAIRLRLADAVDEVALEADGRVMSHLHAGSSLEVRLRSDAARIVRLDPARHSNRGMVKLSLLDLPLRRDQLLDLVPEELREAAARRRP